MVADYCTKPLQGSLFIKLHNHIMGAEYGDGAPHSVLDEADKTNSELGRHKLCR